MIVQRPPPHHHYQRILSLFAIVHSVSVVLESMKPKPDYLKVKNLKYKVTFVVLIKLSGFFSLTFGRTAVYMSELLHTFGILDWRLRPLVFTIRRWAAEVGLTNPSPGRWITNFSLTLLVIFYLQRAKVLPSLDSLRQKAGKISP